MATLLSVPSYATTMCAENDSVVVILDPSINGTGFGYEKSKGTWSTSFPYGYVSGISVCLNSNKGQGTGGWMANLTDINPDGEEKTVAGSEKYGRYCWCKATHPVSSRWVFNSDRGSASSCNSVCAENCGYYTRINEAMRTGLLNSINN